MNNKIPPRTNRELEQDIEYTQIRNDANTEWVMRRFIELEKDFWEWRGAFEERLEKLEEKKKKS